MIFAALDGWRPALERRSKARTDGISARPRVRRVDVREPRGHRGGLLCLLGRRRRRRLPPATLLLRRLRRRRSGRVAVLGPARVARGPVSFPDKIHVERALRRRHVFGRGPPRALARRLRVAEPADLAFRRRCFQRLMQLRELVVLHRRGRLALRLVSPTRVAALASPASDADGRVARALRREACVHARRRGGVARSCGVGARLRVGDATVVQGVLRQSRSTTSARPLTRLVCERYVARAQSARALKARVAGAVRCKAGRPRRRTHLLAAPRQRSSTTARARQHSLSAPVDANACRRRALVGARSSPRGRVAAVG